MSEQEIINIISWVGCAFVWGLVGMNIHMNRKVRRLNNKVIAQLDEVVEEYKLISRYLPEQREWNRRVAALLDDMMKKGNMLPDQLQRARWLFEAHPMKNYIDQENKNES